MSWQNSGKLKKIINFKVFKAQTKTCNSILRTIYITLQLNRKLFLSLKRNIFLFHWSVTTLAAMVALANSLLGGMISDHGSVSDIYQIVCQHPQLFQQSSIILPPLSVIQFKFPSSSCQLMPRYFDKVGTPLFLYIKIVLCLG